MSTAHSESLEQIKKDGVVRVGFANDAPWSFAKADGSMAGADYELAALVFAKLGVPALEGVLNKFGALIPGLKAHRYDVISTGLYIRPSRCEQVAFSEPTIAVGDGVIVKAGNPKKIESYESVTADTSLKLGAVVGAATVNNATASGVPSGQIVMFPDNVSAVAGVKSGRVDGAIMTLVAAETIIREAKDSGIARAFPFKQAVINGKPAINYAAFAFRPEDGELLSAFNTELAKVLGTPEHLAILANYGLSKDEIPRGISTSQLCKP